LIKPVGYQQPTYLCVNMEYSVSFYMCSAVERASLEQIFDIAVHVCDFSYSGV